MRRDKGSKNNGTSTKIGQGQLETTRLLARKREERKQEQKVAAMKNHSWSTESAKRTTTGTERTNTIKTQKLEGYRRTATATGA